MSIIPQPRQLTFWEYIQSPSEDGSEKKKSNRTGHQVGSAVSSKGKLRIFAGIELPTTTVCYARVSSYSQREDLERQLAYLRAHYPEAEFISEIGGGLNFFRRKFQWLSWVYSVNCILRYNLGQ